MDRLAELRSVLAELERDGGAENVKEVYRKAIELESETQQPVSERGTYE